MKKLSLLLITLGIVSCAHQSGQDHLTMATLWTQQAGEAKALSYQAFNIAKTELKKQLRRKNKKPLAVVVDVDETVLDNSPFQARGILKNTRSPDGWREWIDAAEAKPLPGAIEFLNYAKKRGVAVFYITNRKQIGRDATIKNLRAVGFPVNPEHVMCRITSSSKKERRSEVLENFKIALLMGDNLGDFSELFELNNVKKRNQLVDEHKNHFGSKFIVLPNAMYGNWEGAVYKGNFKQTGAQKRSVRYDSLVPFSL